ncbi:MAG TPA: lysophospholipid acyltransferase family protein, partial [Pseudomonadales bacterium]|nr:lysophospholipid acyltransferase family protein [Pseudomonadales bacterium]
PRVAVSGRIVQNIEQSTPGALQRRLFAIYKWGVVAPFLALSTCIIGSSVVLLSMAGMPDFASRVLGTLWAKLNMAVSMISIDIEGKEKVDPNQSYVIVANHQSLVDIYVLYGYLGIDIKWVMKKELRAVPFLGIACEKMGHILIDRSDTGAALKSINKARDKIANGISIVFFAEGTRSRNGELKKFKKGAFRMAQELGLPILPVTIRNTRFVLPSDTMDLMPGRVKLVFNDPIPTTDFGPGDVAELTNRTREVIRHSLEGEEPI